MSVPSPEIELPTDTQLGYSHELAIDIDLNPAGTVGEPVWQRVRFISNADPQVSPVTQSAPTYEDRGSPNEEKTSESWTLAFNIQEHHKPDGSLLPELKRLMDSVLPTAVGNAATVSVRWYDWPEETTRPINPDYAFSGIGTVALVRSATGADGAVSGWNVTITGKGKRAQIEHPNAGELGE